MASFSNDVKDELCSGITDRDKMYSCLYGVVLYCKNISASQISVSTESKSFARLIEKLIKGVFGRRVEYSIFETEKKNGVLIYNICIDGEESVKNILSEYIIDFSNREINLKNIVNNSLNSFLAGVFFVCGSVTDPYKEYHLEFNIPCKKICDELYNILMNLGIEAGVTERKTNYVLYIKDSENIEDILTFIGATQGTLDLMNIKIYKDIRNKANRIANCDSANIDKVISAALRQIDDINVIIDSDGFDSLSSDLKEIAELRLENPEYSLSEIGQLLKKPIGRSGVTKRFRKIAALADGIRNKV